MKGLLIPGRTMPNNCQDCPCRSSYYDGMGGEDYYCEAGAYGADSIELDSRKLSSRPDWCVLVEVEIETKVEVVG